MFKLNNSIFRILKKFPLLVNYLMSTGKDGFVYDSSGLNSVMKMNHATLCQKAFWIQC